MSSSSSSSSSPAEEVESPKKEKIKKRVTIVEQPKFDTEALQKFLSNQLEVSISSALVTALKSLREEEEREKKLQVLRAQSTPNFRTRTRDDEEEATSVDIEDDEEEEDDAHSCFKEPIGLSLITLQAGLILLYAFFTEYDDEQVIKIGNGTDTNVIHQYYGQFQDVQVMVFLGIGVLMSFLRKYGYTAIGFCLLAGTLAVEWAVLVKGMVHFEGGKIKVGVVSLISADFSAAVVLITYGTVIGHASPLQLIFMTFAEVVAYICNEYVCSVWLKTIDTGGSVLVHIFAAYFGLGVSRAMISVKDVNEKNAKASYNSNIVSLVATLLLFLFWPSFNSALSAPKDQQRVVMNTILSLFSSCVFAFATSSLLNGNKFAVAQLQNGALAGGVAVGAVVDLIACPFGPLSIGAIGGLTCVLSMKYLQPWITKVFGIFDSCGVHNLHGVPGLVGAGAGIIIAALATEEGYGTELYLRYPARAPEAGSKGLLELQSVEPGISGGVNRSAGTQAMFQLAALGVTILISFAAGAITGLLMRLPLCGKVEKSDHYEDAVYFEEDEEEAEKESASTNKVSPALSNGVASIPNGSELVARRNNKYTF